MTEQDKWGEQKDWLNDDVIINSRIFVEMINGIFFLQLFVSLLNGVFFLQLFVNFEKKLQ